MQSPTLASLSNQKTLIDNSDDSLKKKRKREGNEKTQTKKKIQLNIDNSFVSKEISTFICNEIVNKFKIIKYFEPTDKTPFFIIYSNARELMKKIPSLVETIYNMEISKEFKLSNLIPIGFDAEYRKDWKISNIQISLQGISFVIQIENLKDLPNELIEFLQSKTIKLGVGVCNDINHLFTQKTDLKDSITPNIVDLAIVSSQYHLFGSSLVSLKSLALELLKMETIRNDKSQDGFVKYAAFDAYIGYASIYKLYEIMSSEDFEPWIKSQCKQSDDDAFQVNTTISNNKTTNNTTTSINGTTSNSSNNTIDNADDGSNNLLKGKSLTSLKELSKLDPNATDKEREELLNMRSTYMGMMYGDKTSTDQLISYAKEKNQARLRKMAHKNSTQRNITNLVDQMKQKQPKKESKQVTKKNETKTTNTPPSNSETTDKSGNVASMKKEKKAKNKKSNKKEYSPSNISFQLV